MPAGKPRGSAPDTKIEQSTDDIEDSSLLDSNDLEQTDVQEPDVELDENDLSEIKDSQKVPYSRFKDQVNKRKELEGRIARLENESNTNLQSTISQYEAKLQALQNNRSFEEDDLIYEDEPSREVRALKEHIAKLEKNLTSVSQEVSSTKLTSNLERLQAKYPDADQMAVLGWAKAAPDEDLEDLMEKSHVENKQRVQAALKKLIDARKAKKKSFLPSGGTPLIANEGDRPKTLKESKAALDKYLANR